MNNFKLKICFGKSKSTYYRTALDIASGLPQFKMASENTPNILLINKETMESRNNIRLIEELWSIVGRWKSAQLIFGSKIKTGRNAREAIRPLECYCKYQQAVVQELYCRQGTYLPGWGCKLLDTIEPQSYFNYRNEVYWYQFGHFVTDTIWRIDKAEIIRLLRREIDLKCLELCPIFSFNKVKKYLDRKPDEIDLSRSNLWEEFCIEEPGCEPKLVGIKPVNENPRIIL